MLLKKQRSRIQCMQAVLLSCEVARQANHLYEGGVRQQGETEANISLS